MDTEFYSVEEVADRLKVSQQTVRAWLKDGKIESYQFGRQWRIRRDEVERLIQASKRKPQPTIRAWLNLPPDGQPNVIPFMGDDETH